MKIAVVLVVAFGCSASPVALAFHGAQGAGRGSKALHTSSSTTSLNSYFPGANFDATGRRSAMTTTTTRPTVSASATTAPPRPPPRPIIRAPPSTYDYPLARPQQPRQPQRGPMVPLYNDNYDNRSRRGSRPTYDMDILQELGSRPVIARDAASDIVFDTGRMTDSAVVQGGSLRSWSFPNPKTSSVQVFLRTEGRPLNSVIELWHGPDSTPVKCAVYLEDGDDRAFSAVFATPRGMTSTNSLSVKNTSPMEFPIEAAVEASRLPLHAFVEDCMSRDGCTHKNLQGGSVCTVPLQPSVQSVAVLLRTKGRPLNARLELLEGPTNTKQVLEIYSENGLDRPFFTIVETPGQLGSVVRVVNTATIEFPITINVQPYAVDASLSWNEEEWRRRHTPEDFFFAL